jgi:hypothetical protein
MTRPPERPEPEPWRDAWRRGFAPQLSLKELLALKAGLEMDDPQLAQGATCIGEPAEAHLPPVYRAVIAACAIGYCAWRGLGCHTVRSVEERFDEVWAGALRALGAGTVQAVRATSCGRRCSRKSLWRSPAGKEYVEMTTALQARPHNGQPQEIAEAGAGLGQRGVVLRTMNDLARFSAMVHASGLAPKGFATPQAIAVAVQLGLEVGLSPMQAVQSIAVINGRPGLFGDAALAVIRASGLLDEFEEFLEGEGDARRAVCVSLRRGSSRPRRTVFSVADAKRAKLWGKAGPWQEYPDRMLLFRARGFNLRDEFGDVLKGIRTVEELRDFPAPPPSEAGGDAEPDRRAAAFSRADGPHDAAAPHASPPGRSEVLVQHVWRLLEAKGYDGSDVPSLVAKVGGPDGASVEQLSPAQLEAALRVLAGVPDHPAGD